MGDPEAGAALAGQASKASQQEVEHVQVHLLGRGRNKREGVGGSRSGAVARLMGGSTGPGAADRSLGNVAGCLGWRRWGRDWILWSPLQANRAGASRPSVCVCSPWLAQMRPAAGRGR